MQRVGDILAISVALYRMAEAICDVTARKGMGSSSLHDRQGNQCQCFARSHLGRTSTLEVPLLWHGGTETLFAMGHRRISVALEPHRDTKEAADSKKERHLNPQTTISAVSTNR
jgi:hypothetical protein